MNKKALAQLFYRELEKIIQAKDLTKQEKVVALYQLLNKVFVELTKKDRLHFTTLFARIAYTCHQYDVDRKQQFWIHRFRKLARSWMNASQVDKKQLEKDYQLSLKVLANTLEALFHVPPPTPLQALIPKKIAYQFSQKEITGFHASLRVVVLDIDTKQNQLIVKDESNPQKTVRVQFNIPERNANFNPSIKALYKDFDFPITVNLLDVEIDKEGIYRPKAFVIEPDHLVDVSAVAECFKHYGAVPLVYLLKKFLPFEYTKYLMIGNIANYFLDELLSNPEASFQEIFPKVFQLNPLAFAVFENSIVREIMQKSQLHYVNLKKVITQELTKQGIRPKDCTLEPTFYSDKYGLQGRLDIFYHKDKAAIIELKSGKTFRPNIYGINANHFVQTLLYDLIIESVLGKKTNPTNYILYSGVENRQLRFAPVIKAQQMEAIQVRNQLLAIERKLTKIGLDQKYDAVILNQLRASSADAKAGFFSRDLAVFEKVFNNIPTLERKYFAAYTGFIAREHQLAKTGIQSLEERNGQAALWLNAFREKQEQFELISHLIINTFDTNSDDPVLHFDKTDETNPLANFRVGDIAVLYPFRNAESSPLKNQLFKCTIIGLDQKSVTVRLRSKQFHQAIFHQKCHWNLEHDLLDSSFNTMYRSLFEFIKTPTIKRNLLLAKSAPEKAKQLPVDLAKELTEQQSQILQQIISAKDYFLLWGPPGTGKTSMMLKNLVAHLKNNTKENILLLAYTNRAVDEICEAIEQIDENIRDDYFRIGSRFSTPDRFKSQLFSTKTKAVRSRQELRNIIESHRIVVSTVASISSKSQLLQLKHFHTAIIDEASQILEPMLVGLLPKFKRFILIGDHKQLPAVVVQDEWASAVHDKDLQAIGLNNLRNSLFERLYQQCIDKDWNWAYAQLSHQGRMHEEIMRFPNEQFYGGSLNILPDSNSFSKEQKSNINLTIPKSFDEPWKKLLCTERNIYIPTPVDDSSKDLKSNKHEAKLVAEIIKAYQKIYALNHKVLTAKSIGIITPFRAQIATIRHELQKQALDFEFLTVDTVERYQGSARDIIVISLCANNVSKMSAISSISTDGQIDRKLNVALTRARQQLIVLGNSDILKTNPIYRKLIEGLVSDVGCFPKKNPNI